MSEFPDDIKGVFVQPTNVLHTEKGPTVSGTMSGVGGISKKEAKELVAETYGIDQERIHLGEDEMRQTAAGRISVGFQKWNSSWDPHAERDEPADPSLN